MPASSRRITPESFVAAFVVPASAVMAAGYVLDAIGLSMFPLLLAGVGMCAAVAAFLVVREPSPAPAGSLAGLGLVVAAALAYLVWLAWPSLLPVTDGPDVVHHLQLIHFIERTHRLVHDPGLRPYFGEMIEYTPGSHIAAAMTAEWLRVDPVRVLFAVTAAFAAVKAGVVYALALRAIGGVRGAALMALAAPVLLLVPSGYVLGAFFKFYFYAQVVSETFAMAMLLGVIGWMRTRERPCLWLASASGVGVVLSWPVWIVPAGVAVAAAIALSADVRREDDAPGAVAPARASRPALLAWRARASAAAVVLGPCVAFAAWHAAAHPSGASILRSSGDVLRPSVAALGAGFVALAAAGFLLGAASRLARPVAVLLAAAVLVAVALAPAAAPGYYLPFKMVYLAVLPAAVLGAFALARPAAWMASVPRIGVAAPIVPLVVAIVLSAGRYPLKRPSSPMTEPSLAAGLWARGTLPAACVDYFSRHWLTGYWLHLDVLGNARDSDRMRAETFEFHDTASRWIEGRGLPYAIVEDLSAIPHEARADMIPLREFPPAAVVKNSRPPRLGSDPNFQLCGVK